MSEYVCDILNRIMDERNLKVAEVARICGLPASTVRGIITRKQKSVALEVAFKLSDGLNISLRELNGQKGKKNPELTEVNSGDVHPLLKIYNELNTNGQNRLMEYAEELTEIPKYKKCSDTENKAIG